MSESAGMEDDGVVVVVPEPRRSGKPTGVAQWVAVSVLVLTWALTVLSWGLRWEDGFGFLVPAILLGLGLVAAVAWLRKGWVWGLVALYSAALVMLVLRAFSGLAQYSLSGGHSDEALALPILPVVLLLGSALLICITLAVMAVSRK